jgi:hypothetical protein
MKNIISFLLLLLTVFPCQAQQLKAKEVQNADLDRLLLREVIKSDKFDLEHSEVRIYTVDGASDGSVNKDITEGYNDLFIANCKHDKYVNCHSYLLESLVDVKVEKAYEEGSDVKIVLSHGKAPSRKTETLTIPGIKQ